LAGTSGSEKCFRFAVTGKMEKNVKVRKCNEIYGITIDENEILWAQSKLLRCAFPTRIIFLFFLILVLIIQK
jgi:hypothetical protein